MVERIRSAFYVVCAVTTLLAITSSAGAANNSVKADKVSLNWYMGMPVVASVLIPRNLGGTGPTAPSDKAPVTVYLTAPMGGGVDATPDRMIPTPQGPRLLPALQHTLGALAPESQPRDGMGYFVLKGDKGDATNVKVNEFSKEVAQTPSSSLSGAPLAYEIKIGPTWVQLNSHVVIEYGVRTGLLKLVPFMYSGRMWMSAVDGGTLDLAAPCQSEAH